MKKIHRFWIIVIILVAFGLGYYSYFLNTEAKTVEKNSYDYSFSEVVNYINNIENYLAKARISKSSMHSTETLTRIWSDSNLAIVHFENIPFIDNGNNKSIKFLNQVSDYSYTLLKKTLQNEELSQKDFNNLKILYDYSTALKDILNELSTELYNGTISWESLNEKTNVELGDVDIFSSIESNFDDYEGLIYDGAYSDYIIKDKKLGLVGEEISQEEAENRVKDFFNDYDIHEINSNGEISGDSIAGYSFSLRTKKIDSLDVYISKKGGWMVQVLSDRNVKEEKISQEKAVEDGKEYLKKFGYKDMKETYYTKQGNIITVNYAYTRNGIVMYPDLIKVKVALDNGDILGMEATGYLNNHHDRELNQDKISNDEAKNKLNSDIEILSEGEAIIPLDNNEEVYCYEFKGRIEEKQFLVYINTNSGKEEEILMILETPGGTLTI